MSRWLIVGISGATNSGKSTLAKKLLEVLPDTTRIICQDDYFYPEDSPQHIPCPGGLPHHNWDVISSLDMNKMIRDITEILKSTLKPNIKTAISKTDASERGLSCLNDSHVRNLPVLLLEGFLLFGDDKLAEMCDLRYFLTLNHKLCWERRSSRIYNPPDPPGYFEHCVWPMYESHLKYVKEHVPDLKFVCGKGDPFPVIHQEILAASRSLGYMPNDQLLHYNDLNGLKQHNAS
ncbi:nicotinamide riboside kinase 2-like [Procambarus clarkii]|uniref:nicotinamide riboside kinase 2-like n=1 Tax=Procambarus clarkii TaxID=6728 RepID=UPI001E676167|nr:nicotinamide riboside kinase 2-like [Procambarus clarkii]